MASKVMSAEELQQYLRNALDGSAFESPNPGFDKEPILARHNAARSAMAMVRTSKMFSTCLNISHPSEPQVHPGKPSALARYKLKSILLSQLRLGDVHHGRVLYGTLIAQPFSMSSLMSVIEDGAGSACVVTVAADGIQESGFPMGSKVAILEPYFKVAMDGSPAIRVDAKNRLVRIDGISELVAMRLEGNALFSDKKWAEAVEAYTKCIAACSKLLQEVKKGTKKRGEIEAVLVAAVANRAEARLRAGENEAALEDCNAALAMEGEHVKSLYRKGRALLAMGKNELAVESLSKAAELDPENKEIGEALEKARAGGSE